MAITITDLLNQWNQAGVFSYLIPMLLIFAVVFAVLEKTGVLSKKKITEVEGKKVATPEENRGVSAIIALAVALLSIQFDVVPIFFAQIFPNFGVGLSIVLVTLIILGMVDRELDAKWGGWIIAGGLFIWAILNWGEWFGGGYTFMYWIRDNYDTLLWMAFFIGVFAYFVFGGNRNRTSTTRGGGVRGP